MMQKNIFNYNQIRKYYLLGNYQPIEPSSFVKQHGELYFGYLKKAFSSLYSDKVTILLGYYAVDINTKIKEINSFFTTREQATDIVTCNMLLFEFTYDLLLFNKYRDTSHFIAIFKKYMQLLIGDAGKEFSSFLQMFSEKKTNSSKKEDKDLLLKTLAAINFIILHEHSHFKKDLLKTTLNLFNETTEFAEHLAGFSDEQIEEAACDFNALYFMTSSQFPLNEIIETALRCSTTDSLFCGLIMLNADALLQLLKCCFSLGAKTGPYTIEAVFSLLSQQLMTRSKPLLVAAKFTENTEGLSLGETDIKLAFSEASSLINSFYTCASEAMHSMAEAIKNINKAPSSEVMLTLNDPIEQDRIWFLIS